jgi:hypothetical protein
MMLSDLESCTIFGNQLVNVHDFNVLAAKLMVDLVFTLIIVRGVFYPVYKERDYVFTAIVINIAIFFICYLMESIKLKIGFAFGLFAVFAILRYRTEQIPIREMTYMFAVIIIAVLNALSDDKISYAELFFANITITVIIVLLEKDVLHDDDTVKVITYEKIDLIKPENYPLLISDLRERTGLFVKRAEIDSINFLNDTARLRVLFERPKQLLKLVDSAVEREGGE